MYKHNNTEKRLVLEFIKIGMNSMRRIKNKNLEELLNKPIDNNRVFDIGYEQATANAIDWFDSFLRYSDGNLGMWDNGSREDFIKFMMQE